MKVRSQFFKKDYDLTKAELIGQGTFAQVYRAFESALNDSIAIRRVRKVEADLQDIMKERQINDELRKVDNQNILKIYDIVEETEAVWYITQYCSGGSLWDALNICQDNKMNEREGLQCILQISRGVQELHNHRITHRDLKPENILLKTKYTPGKPLPLIKLADFGLSTRKIIMETIAGTKEYIAPEQAKFHNYTNAVDVWSLGIIFDQILHGNPFYSGEDNKEVFNKILKMPFKVRDEGLRTSVKELLVSLLKKKPYERPIIAIIRSTIEKILLEIDTEMGNHLQAAQQKGKKSKSNSNNNINSSISGSKLSEHLRSTIGVDFPHKMISPKIENAVAYSSHKVMEKDMDRVEKVQKKIDRGYFKKDFTPHSSKAHPSKQFQNLSADVHETKDLGKNLEKSTSSNYFVKKVVKAEKTPPKREEEEVKQPDSARPVRPVPKFESGLKSSQFGVAELPEKITVYKVDRRKLMGSSVNAKKQQFQLHLVDIISYMERVHASKKELCDRQLKLQRQRVFLPNTYLTAADFQKNSPNTKQIVGNFSKKFDFLNYFSTNPVYEIKMLKSQSEMRQTRRLCEQQLMLSRESIRELFFSQLQIFIDQFIEKVIK